MQHALASPPSSANGSSPCAAQLASHRSTSHSVRIPEDPQHAGHLRRKARVGSTVEREQRAVVRELIGNRRGVGGAVDERVAVGRVPGGSIQCQRLSYSPMRRGEPEEGSSVATHSAWEARGSTELLPSARGLGHTSDRHGLPSLVPRGPDIAEPAIHAELG